MHLNLGHAWDVTAGTAVGLGTLAVWSYDSASGAAMGIVGGILVALALGLPRALPAIKSLIEMVTDKHLDYCTRRDAMQLAAEVERDTKLGPSFARKLERISEQLEAAQRTILAAEAKAAAAEQRAARIEEHAEAAEREARREHHELTDKLIAAIEDGNARAVRHADANSDQIKALHREAERLGIPVAEHVERMAETAQTVDRIEEVVSKQDGDDP